MLFKGTTAQETDSSPFFLNMTSWTWADYENVVSNHMNTFDKKLVDLTLQMYPSKTITPEYQFTTLSSDIRVTCGNDLMALQASNNNKSPVYRYIVTAVPSQPVHILNMPFPSSYSFHMLDALAFFGSLKYYITPLSQSDIDLTKNMRREALSFIKLGIPASALRGGWKPFPNSTALVGSDTKINETYHGQQCHFWLTEGFFGYSWIN